MPGISNPRFNQPGGRLPPLSREAEDALEASQSPTQRGSELTTPPLTTKNRKLATPPNSHKYKNKGLAGAHSRVTNSKRDIRSDMQIAVPTTKDLILHTSSRKPRFLDDLENFLLRELNSLGVEEVEPNETRLQAHREVFEYLIEDFKTYKPIFAAIKNEYEMMISRQQLYIRQLQPLQQMLVTVTEQCDNGIMKFRDQEKDDILQLKRQNGRLQNIIDQIRNDQFALQTQVEKLQQKLTDQYDKYRSEATARKLLVSDINDLRTQQEELILQQQQASNRDESEDPVLIRLALKKARESEREASLIINDMIANYGDVIPKQDYITLQTQYKALQEQVAEKTGQFDQLKEEHDSLLETHKQIIKQRDEYYQESERLRQTATPRPDWNRCGDVIAGGMHRWNELSQGKSSDDLVSILLNELAGSSADANIPDHFESMGTGDEVPFYLRKVEGKVKNRRLGKRDATLLIKDVWKEKDVFDSSQPAGSVRQPMAEYLIQYLTLKFANYPEMVTEWAYNLDNACQRYGEHDEKIQLFYSVLNKKVDQELYFIQLQYIVSLLKLLTKENEGHEPADVFTSEEFQQVLVTFFDDKVFSEDIEKLMTAAHLELDDADSTDIEFTKLFFEDDEGKFGPFIDELKRLLTGLRLKYSADIVDSMRKAELELVTEDDLTRAITLTDPELEPGKRDAIVAWVYRDKKPVAELEAPFSLPLEEVETQLNSIHIKKFL